MNKSVFVSILSVLLLLLISSCNKEIKEEEFPNYIVHTIDITGDQTWSGDTHLIQGTVVLNDLILTIEPGCIVLFDIDAELIIGDSLPTAIIANGTEEEPIIFTSVNKEDALPGDWEYVKFMENTDASTSLNHCKFLYGGGNFSDIGIIHLSDCHISVENCEFAYSTHYGVTLGDGAYFDNFKNNTIRDCQSYAIKTEAKSVTSFERSNTIESDSGIFITDEYFKERDITWINHGVPYSFNDDFIIGAPGGSKLRLEPGTVVRMGRNGSINVGLSQDEPGTLIAAGTETEPIVFTSENSLKSPGDWKYLWFDEGASSSTKLEYCLIEYGGGYTENTGMVEIRNCKINMDNCTIKRSKQYGINAYIEGGFESFSGNTVEFN
ncbi:MAG: right-handed parallel beta-helix repeat-containing protein, partial [Bacteroidales bacterium]|nr:right-handed parallel beta-helix repeat-containing protein [Bacteroidales bacterium]